VHANRQLISSLTANISAVVAEALTRKKLCRFKTEF